MDGPRIFAIGFDCCGGGQIGHYFRTGGFEVADGTKEPLAEALLRARASNVTPLRQWADARVFVELWDYKRPALPLLQGFKAFAYLAEHFEDAIFLLNTRHRDTWLANRKNSDDHAILHQHVRDTLHTRQEMPGVWADDWDAHHADVRAFFGGSDRLIELQMDADWQVQLFTTLGDRLALPDPDPDASLFRRDAPPAPQRMTTNMAPRLIELSEGIAAHCLGQRTTGPVSDWQPQKTNQLATFDGHHKVTWHSGEPLPVIRAGENLSDGFLPTDKTDPPVQRAMGVLNDLRTVWNEGTPIRCDMLDARGYGRQADNPPMPVFVYNRRPQARNCVLWPLVGYHSMYRPHFVSTEPADDIPFEDKEDVCVWRGNLSGGTVSALNPERLKYGGSIGLMNRYAEASDEEKSGLLARLDTLTRYHLTRRLQGVPGFDFAMVLGPKRRMLRKDPAWAGLISDPKPVTWFHRYKYVASLSGFDTGSNFLMAVNSNSLVFKEKEDWELFYSHLYKPWEHYVPISPGGRNLEERIDWARANPKRALEITQNARRVSADVARITVRRAFQRMVAEEVMAWT
ncbi:glycosyl transferase family 90 [Shimia ponticola]|uniref:glycosyl transferase family 90 n=1 Tax=Shimia ponticola TaxID=2582893 RepID=UPI0011BF5C9A|nr:glycosyl transferase family 90 [Shimia ponticola]